MSTTPETVEVDIFRDRHEATVLEELSDRANVAAGPITEYRVDVDGSTFVVGEDDVYR